MIDVILRSFDNTNDTGVRMWSQTHDIEIMPNGNILVLANEVYSAAELISMGRDPKLLENQTEADVPVVYEISPTGTTNATIVWRWRWVDRFVQNRTDAGTAASLYVSDISSVPERIDLNINSLVKSFEHPNAIDYNPILDQIGVSCRQLNEVFLFEHTASTDIASAHTGGRYGKGGDFLYRWGNPQNYGRGSEADQVTWYQHSLNWVTQSMPGEGNLMIYNDGAFPGPDGTRSFTSGRSAAIEIKPPLLPNGTYAIDNAGRKPFGPTKPVWEFHGNSSFSFYSYIQGGAFRLPNGNTFLTTPGENARVIEVTAGGGVVWVMHTTAVRSMKWPASYVPAHDEHRVLWSS